VASNLPIVVTEVATATPTAVAGSEGQDGGISPIFPALHTTEPRAPSWSSELCCHSFEVSGVLVL
jgi:hypothetical protein